jgi:hypothetical protein
MALVLLSHPSGDITSMHDGLTINGESPMSQACFDLVIFSNCF